MKPPLSGSIGRLLVRIGMAVLVTSILASCLPGSAVDEPEPWSFDPNLATQAKANCEARGGDWAGGGISGNMVCYMRTNDADQACSSERDCEGLCLARSRSCAPVTPLLGCNDILNADGVEQTLCLQ